MMLVAQVERIRQAARSFSPELSFAEIVGGEPYQVGYVRFEPNVPKDGKMVVHDDLDVVCVVLAGRGRLRHGRETTDVEAGAVCRIPRGTPHDFSAAGQPLEMLSITIRVGAPRSKE